MRIEQIEQILNNNTDKIDVYLNILLDKCKELERQSTFISLLMLILFAINYLSKNAIAESLQIGPLSIKDIKSIDVFIPLVFAFLIFRFIIIHNHKAEIHKILSVISKKHFNNERINLNENDIDDFTRTILPVSNYNELGKYNTKGVLGCFGVLLILPIIFIALIPIIIEYFWIKEYLLIFSQLNFIHKCSIVASIWITLIAIYHVLQAIYNGVMEAKRK